jgi:hypothetical protein
MVGVEVVRPSQAPKSKGRQIGGKINILSENFLFYMFKKLKKSNKIKFYKCYFLSFLLGAANVIICAVRQKA